MTRLPAILLTTALLVAMPACSSDDGGGIRTALFLPEPRTPGPAQIFISQEDVDLQSVTVAIRVRDLAEIAEADLALEYAASRLVFSQWLPGSLLEQGMTPVSYTVFEQIPGRLRVRAVRGAADGATAGLDDPSLVVLRFKVVALGGTPAQFSADSELLDPQGTSIMGVRFFAGTFNAS